MVSLEFIIDSTSVHTVALQ